MIESEMPSKTIGRNDNVEVHLYRQWDFAPNDKMSLQRCVEVIKRYENTRELGGVCVVALPIREEIAARDFWTKFESQSTGMKKNEDLSELATNIFKEMMNGKDLDEGQRRFLEGPNGSNARNRAAPTRGSTKPAPV